MEYLFFRNIRDLTPKMLITGGYNVVIPNNGRLIELENEIEIELEKLSLFLLGKSIDDRRIVVNWITDEILTGYYLVRLCMKGKSNEEHSKILPLLNLFYFTLTAIIYTSVKRLSLEYTDTYINSWKKRTSYFPFEDIMKLDQETKHNQTPPKELRIDKAKDEPNPINIERLKSYFKAQFKGMGDNENYFENNLIPDLQIKLSGRQLATIALIIYDSDKMINKPTSFDKWYTEFCNIMGAKKLSYRPSQLNPSEIKPKYYYL